MNTVYGWYARTREQADLGPFESPVEASRALTRHIKVHRGLNPRTSRTPKRMHLHDSDQCRKTNCALCVEARVLSQSMAVAAV